MFQSVQKSHISPVYRFFVSFLAFTFAFSLILTPTPLYAQSNINLPVPGTMVGVSEAYIPAMIRGITINLEDPFQFDFIVDAGDDYLEGEAFNAETEQLIKYFLTALTVPEDNMWVNLSPYEKDRIVPDGFGQTEMGRDLLAQDYLLKQLTSSLMFPEDELGSAFWQRVRDRAQAEFGTTDVPMDTFNKIWIVPARATVYENNNSVFVVDSYLKVMLEEDYLALENNSMSSNFASKTIEEQKEEQFRGVTKQIVREILVPEIEREINTGKNFAKLRQIHNSVVLATWYKQNLKESIFGQIYIDQTKTNGIENANPNIKQEIYDQYVESFRKGVYSYIKEEYNPTTQETIPRKYFSGGILESVDFAMVDSANDLAQSLRGRTLRTATANLQGATDSAQISDKFIFRQDERLGNLRQEYTDVYTPKAMAALEEFLPFAQQIQELDEQIRREDLERLARGEDPQFNPEENDDGSDHYVQGMEVSVKQARTGDFEGAAVPQEFLRSGAVQTGPVSRAGADLEKSLRSIAYILLSGAEYSLLDGEDSLGQLDTMSLDGIRNLKHAYAKTPVFMKVSQEIAEDLIKKGKKPEGWNWQELLDTNYTTRVYRPRGQHLDDAHLKYQLEDGSVINLPGSYVDTILYLINTYEILLDQGSTLAVYLPKAQDARQTALYNKLLDAFEAKYEYNGQKLKDIVQEDGKTGGLVKTIPLIENVKLAMQAPEVRASLGRHIIGLNMARWDYIGTVIKAKDHDANWIPDDFGVINMEYPFMAAAEDALWRAVNREDRNGNTIFAEGGMDVQIPVIPDDIPQDRKDRIIEGFMATAQANKTREANAGFSRAWVAHPEMVDVVAAPFKEIYGEGGHPVLNQTETPSGKAWTPLTQTDRDAQSFFQLADTPTITVEGIRQDISVSIQYSNNTGVGQGAASIKPANYFANSEVPYLMEDRATREGRDAGTRKKYRNMDKVVFTADDESAGIQAGDVLTPELYEDLKFLEFDKLTNAPSRIVFDSSKETTLVIAKDQFDTVVEEDVDIPWSTDLETVTLGVTDPEEAKQLIDNYIDRLRADPLSRLTVSESFVAADAAMVTISTQDRQEIAEIENELFWDPVTKTGNPRFKYTVRDYGPKTIWRLRGKLHSKLTVANKFSRKLWDMMDKFEENWKAGNGKPTYILTGGATTGPQILQMVKAGLKAAYGSGWQGSNARKEPDQALYPDNTMPDLIAMLNDSLEKADIEAQETFKEMLIELPSILERLYQTDWQQIKALGNETEAKNSFVNELQKLVEGSARIFLGGKERTASFLALFQEVVNNAAELENVTEQTQQSTLDWLRLILAQHVIDYIIPTFADGDTGHDSIDNLVDLFVKARAALIHIEDQATGKKKCGHMCGKVAIPLKEQIVRLKQLRRYSDFLGAEILSTARTDTEATKLLEQLNDVRDEVFLSGTTVKGIIDFRKAFELSRDEAFEYTSKEEALEILVTNANWGTEEERELLEAKIREIWQLRVEADISGRSPDADFEDEVPAITNATEELSVLWMDIAKLKTLRELGAEIIAKNTGESFEGLHHITGEGLNAGNTVKQWLKETDPLRIIEDADGNQTQNINSIVQLKEIALKYGVNIDQTGWNYETARSYEGYYQIEPGYVMAAFRQREVAAYADFVWVETSRPNIEAERFIAEKLKEFKPSRNTFIALNMSPSFDWSKVEFWRAYFIERHGEERGNEMVQELKDAIKKETDGFDLTNPDTWGNFEEHIQTLNWASTKYTEDLGKAGYRFLFITIFSDHVTNLAMYRAAQGLVSKKKMLSWIENTQRIGIKLGAISTYRFAIDHQSEAGSKHVGRLTAALEQGAGSTGIGSHAYDGPYPDITADPDAPGINVDIKADKNTGVLEFKIRNSDAPIDEDIDAREEFEDYEAEQLAQTGTDKASLAEDDQQRILDEMAIDGYNAAISRRSTLKFSIEGGELEGQALLDAQREYDSLTIKIENLRTNGIQDKIRKSTGGDQAQITDSEESLMESQIALYQDALVRSSELKTLDRDLTLDEQTELQRLETRIRVLREAGIQEAIAKSAGADRAMTEDPNVGGIDFNSGLMDLEVQRDGAGIPLPIGQQPFNAIDINGFIPVIINVQPTNVPLLLGEVDLEESYDLTRL